MLQEPTERELVARVEGGQCGQRGEHCGRVSGQLAVLLAELGDLTQRLRRACLLLS